MTQLDQLGLIKNSFPTFVLASNSAARQSMLRNAGLRFSVQASNVDEAAIKQSLLILDQTAANLAGVLAEAKAREVSKNATDAWVIGGDQVLLCEGAYFDKAVDLAAAKSTLQRLGGRCHELHAAVCLVRDEKVMWQHTSVARMWMRPLSDAFIEAYLDLVGAAVLGSVGCYHIEGRGVQLFERIEGDYFTIMGLPLLPLLNYLHGQKLVSL